jgi:hypothetical protein
VCDVLSRQNKRSKTYNSGDSLVVTHLTTNPPVHCLYMAERTGSLIFSVLWSYVLEMLDCLLMKSVANEQRRMGIALPRQMRCVDLDILNHLILKSRLPTMPYNMTA